MLAISTLAIALLQINAQPPALEADASLEGNAEEQPFNLKRAGFQIGAAMAAGAVWYQTEIELNKLDFDFDRTRSDQWQRLSTGAGYRLDDNNPTLNVGPAFVGSVYHQFARVNGGTMAEAMLFDFVTSSTWELTVEHREVVSINDTIITSLRVTMLPRVSTGETSAR